MKLDQKYFIPFIAVGALFTMLFIAFSSFNFKAQQRDRFVEYTQAYDSLLTLPNPLISIPTDSLRIQDLSGNKTMVLFWASWSEKSKLIMSDIYEVSDQFPNFKVVAALVKDVTENVDGALPNYDFEYIDGTILFNKIRVPGIPSYILLDEEGKLISTHIGFQEGAIKDELIKALK